MLDPDVIVLGGGLSNIARLYTNVPPLLDSLSFSRILPILHLWRPAMATPAASAGAWLWLCGSTVGDE